MGAGIVMTGGGSRMPGLMEIAEDILRRPGRGSLPARLGYPAPIANMPSELAELEFATTIGIAYTDIARVCSAASRKWGLPHA